jgi:hypothetical protein
LSSGKLSEKLSEKFMKKSFDRRQLMPLGGMCGFLVKWMKWKLEKRFSVDGDEKSARKRIITSYGL